MEETTTNKRATNWTDFEVLTLLSVWRDNLDGLRSQRRNSHVYLKMQKELVESGVERSITDIKVKIKNLNRDYRRENTKLGAGSSPSAWKFYWPVHELLCGFPVNNDQIMQESGVLEITADNFEQTAKVTEFGEGPTQESEIPPSKPSSIFLESGNETSSFEESPASSRRFRKRKTELEYEKIRIMQEILEENKRRNKEAEEIDRKLVTLMEEQAETQKQMVQILGRMTDILSKWL